MKQLAIVLMFLQGSLALGQPAATPVSQAWDALKSALQDSNADKRRQAVVAVGTIGTLPQAIQLLEKSLADDKDIEVRQAAAASLGEMKARAAIPNLIMAMDNDDEISFTAARALWNIGDRSGRELLEDVASGEQKNTPGLIAGAKRDARHKLHQPKELAKLGAEQAAGMFLGPFSIGVHLATELHKDSGAPGRLVAITLLAQACDPAGIAAMESAMENDKNDAVRGGAAKALGVCGGRIAIPKLQQMMESEKHGAQLIAAASIVRIDAKRKVTKR